MKYVITGASGPFGSNTTQGLLDRGVSATDLILVSRNPNKLETFAELGADTRQGDFDDYLSLLDAFAGGDKMLMISTSRAGQREPQHRNAVNAAKAAGIKHIVYTSFVGKPQADDSVAVHDHRITEALIKESGIAWTFLRNSQYIEAMRDAAAPAALSSGQWLSASGDGTIAMISREDCIRAAVTVMATEGHQGKTYNITGPELISFRELCDLICELTGKPIAYKDITAEELYAFFDSLGIPRTAQDDHVVDGFGWCSDDMVSFETTIKNGGFAVISDDVEQLTGQKPETVRAFLTRYKEMLSGAA
jgi:NAD(P)H dehydrogenase (quinone)